MTPENALMSYIYSSLFKQHTYGFNERGTLNDIVSLTHDEMKQFHQENYLPINGQAFCYGPQSYVDACLDIVDGVLGDFDSGSHSRDKTEVPWQNIGKIGSAKDTVPYPSYQDVNDFRYAEAWLLNDQHMDLRTELSWHLILELLVGSPTARISQLISTMGLGDDVIGTLDHHLQQWVLFIGSSGIQDKASVDNTMNMIRSALDEIASEGFDKGALVSALSKLEHKVCHFRLFAYVPTCTENVGCLTQ